ncbi:Hypothetical predicted protein [Pelobates cultripes]|uniref:Uncharacterized protein n=1 Tax=Pelobates cultripes TaxID=61616 RepID=A0AAD1S8C2_PELCU|nr:Hypothetical predicted protein [Pelobates cultripes]
MEAVAREDPLGQTPAGQGSVEKTQKIVGSKQFHREEALNREDPGPKGSRAQEGLPIYGRSGTGSEESGSVVMERTPDAPTSSQAETGNGKRILQRSPLDFHGGKDPAPERPPA